MSERVRGLVLLMLAVGGVLASRLAHADSSTTQTCMPSDGVDPHLDPVLAPPADSTARALLTEGKGAHRTKDYDRAIDALKAGAARSSAPVFLYALGQSYRLADRFEEAIEAYELFLERGQPSEALRGVVECHIANMRADLERAAVTMTPTDQPNEPDVVLSQRGKVTSVASRRPWYDDAAGWGLAGGGAMAGTVGSLLLINAASLDDEAALEDRQPAREALREKADNRRLWGGIVTAAGAVALTVGVIKLAITPDGSNAETSTSLVLTPRGVALVGRF